MCFDNVLFHFKNRTYSNLNVTAPNRFPQKIKAIRRHLMVHNIYSFPHDATANTNQKCRAIQHALLTAASVT